MLKNAYLVDDLVHDVRSPNAATTQVGVGNLDIELICKVAENPAKHVRAVAEARTKEAFESLYARALEFCIENEIWRCWSHVFRLDGFQTDPERAAALREFCDRWVRNTDSAEAAVQEISEAPAPRPAIRRLASRIKAIAGQLAAGGSHPARTNLLHDWRELIRALYVLSFYETTDCGRKNFSAIHRTVQTLFKSVREPEAEMTADQREALVRYAISFDLLDVARNLASNGGKDTKFVVRLLNDFAMLTKRNDKFRAKHPAHKLKPAKSIIASTVWGDEFVANFMDYCLASLLSSGNIPHLAKETYVIHSIVTTARDEAKIRAHPLFDELKRHAQIVFHIFDETLLQEREESGFAFYRFYGLLDHVHVDLARKLSCDLYLLPPDVVFSADCMIALSRALTDEGDVCSPAYLEAERLGFLRDIDSFRSGNGVLSLQGRDILACAGKNITNHFRSLVVSPQNENFCRDPREIFWPVAGGLMVHSVYVHPCAVSRRVLSRPLHPNYENVDYAFPARALQSDGKLIVLKDTDAAAAAHFGPTDRANSYLATGFTIRNFVGAHDHDYFVHRECFPKGVFLPCGDLGYPNAAAYRDELSIVVAALDRSIRYQDKKTLLSVDRV